jgi:hypothetical protein
MKFEKFNLLIKSILEKLAYYSENSETLYYPTRKAVRGKEQGMTQVDPSKTFPSSDKTMILKFPADTVKKKKIKR